MLLLTELYIGAVYISLSFEASVGGCDLVE